jgi:hypothetical protein
MTDKEKLLTEQNKAMRMALARIVKSKTVKNHVATFAEPFTMWAIAEEALNAVNGSDITGMAPSAGGLDEIERALRISLETVQAMRKAF